MRGGVRLPLTYYPSTRSVTQECDGSKGFKFVWGQTRLSEDAAEGANGYLSMAGDDNGAATFSGLLGEFDVAAFLTRFGESCCFQLPLDLPVRQRAKRH